MTDDPAPPPGPNLTAVLAGLSLADLGANRIVRRLFLAAQVPGGGAGWVLDDIAAFVSRFAGVLGLAVFAFGVLGVWRRREFFPRGMRLTSIIFSFALVLFAAPGVMSFEIPARLFVHLQLSQAFFVWLAALACWRAAAPGRLKVGVMLFAMPCVLHAAGLFAAQLGAARAGDAAVAMVRLSGIVALCAAATAPLLLSPLWSRGAGPSGRAPALLLTPLFVWAAGLGVVAAFVAGLAVRFDLVQMLALYGLRLEIPPLGSLGALAYAILLALALLGITAAVLQALARRGPSRMAGLGLVLIAAGGMQADSTIPIVIATCGIFALVLGASRTPLMHARV